MLPPSRIALLIIFANTHLARSHESPSNPQNIFKRTEYGTPPGGYQAPPGGWEQLSNYGGVDFNNPDLYKGVFPVPDGSQQNTPPSTTSSSVPPSAPPSSPPAQSPYQAGSAQGAGQGGAGKDGKAGPVVVPTPTPEASVTPNTTPSDGQKDNGQCSKSAAQCPSGCLMNIKFTADSLDVPFTPGSGGKSDQKTTKNACICMTGGSVRVNIGSDNTADHTTLVEGNAAGLNDNSFFDVSYVEGYSYPVVCWNDQDTSRMSGSNIDLYSQGKCSDASKSKMGDICVNDGYPLLASGDPSHDCWKCTLPSAFFAPAAGAAYAYPYDDCPCASDPEPGKRYSSPMANGGDLTCCVGPQCCANTMSHGGQTRKGNCNRPDCQPCSAGFSWGHCSAQCKPGASKRDYERVLHQASLRKRHQHHQHHSH